MGAYLGNKLNQICREKNPYFYTAWASTASYLIMNKNKQDMITSWSSKVNTQFKIIMNKKNVDKKLISLYVHLPQRNLVTNFGTRGYSQNWREAHIKPGSSEILTMVN